MRDKLQARIAMYDAELAKGRREIQKRQDEIKAIEAQMLRIDGAKAGLLEVLAELPLEQVVAVEEAAPAEGG